MNVGKLVSTKITTNNLAAATQLAFAAADKCLQETLVGGRQPVGLLIGYYGPRNDNLAHALAQGVENCCRQYSTYVLGGDTNQASYCCLNLWSLVE